MKFDLRASSLHSGKRRKGDVEFRDANDGVVMMRQKSVLLALGVFVSFCVCFFKSDDRIGCGCADSCSEAAASGQDREAQTAPQSRTFDFAQMSLREARSLEGKRVIARLKIASEAMAADNESVLYSCRSADRLARSVCFPKNRAPESAKIDSEMCVDGQLQIRFHDSWTVSGQVIPAYFELRLIDAEIVKH